MSGMEKVVVGMSGGVDSAVTAYLLKNAGYEVIGVTLRTWRSELGDEGRCCDIDDARAVAYKLGIRYVPVNCISDFQEYVVEPFKNDYLCGRTPNPCVLCNRYVKWEKLMYYAKALGADHIATGHYASVIKLENGRYTVKTAKYSQKDQTYMLYKLTQEQLAATLMPLGGFSKAEVRRIATDAGLPVAAKPDSQEICFVADGGYADYIKSSAKSGLVKEGCFVDESGNVLGKHKGVIYYTVGQRKGLGIALGHPAYVKEIRTETNEVVLSDETSLYSKEVTCGDVNYMSIPALGNGEKLICRAKIRYQHRAQEAAIEGLDGGRVRLEFTDPARAATPGQSAVFYDENDRVIGGGIIESAR